MKSIFTQYHANQYRYRRVDTSQRIKSTDALMGFLDELLASGLILPLTVRLSGRRIRTLEEAEWVLNSLNTPQTRFSSLLNIQSDRQNWQCWTFSPSNLGKGYVFQFVCDGCNKNAMYLYLPDGQHRYLCRECHRINYPTRPQKLTIQRRLEVSQEDQTA